MAPGAEPWDPDRVDEEENEGEVEEQLQEIRAYERLYEHASSWEQLREDEEGRLVALDQAELLRQKRKRQLDVLASARVRRGLIRYLILALDLSAAANDADMKPTRLRMVAALAAQFVRDFFDHNPLSQLCVVALRDGKVHRVSELGASPELHARELARLQVGSGVASLQRLLDDALAVLRNAPPYGLREVLLLSSSLCTVDEGDVFTSSAACVRAKVRVSAVGMGGEVHVLRRVSRETGGTYAVARNERHFEELVEAHMDPPAASSHDAPASLVEMGFAERNPETGRPGFIGPQCDLRSGGYTCPRCFACTREIPARCHVCNLLLISSPHLAKSYHHLFPVKPFVEVDPEDLQGHGRGAGAGDGAREAGPLGLEDWSGDEELPQDRPRAVPCFGCTRDVGARPQTMGLHPGAQPSLILRCEGCEQIFCFECDQVIHGTLHNCPGCVLAAGRA